MKELKEEREVLLREVEEMQRSQVKENKLQKQSQMTSEVSK